MRRLWFLVVATLLVLAGCGNGEDRPGTVSEEGPTGSASGTHSGSASGTGTGSASATHAGAPAAFGEAEADTVVEVTLQDHAFVGIPASLEGPKVFFKATNKGPSEHELEIVDSSGKPVGEIEAMPPGRSGTLALELEPGTYTAQCLVEEEGRTHAELGMKTTFQVT